MPPLMEVSMSHQLKLCTWKELKEVYGIPYCRMHIRRLELGYGSAIAASLGWRMRSSSAQGRVFMSKLTKASNA